MKIPESVWRDLKDEFHLREYSGRGMFGEVCAAVTGSVGEIAGFGLRLGMAAGQELAEEILAHSRQDSMGLGIVLYFPGVTFENFEEEDEEEDDE